MEENIIGKQISFLRNKYKMTQEDLATRIGVSKQTVSNWETGLKTPRMGAIQNLSDLFHVSKSFIIEGNEETDSPEEIMNVYSQLDSKRKQEVINFATFKLFEQKREEENGIYTIAAHSENPERKVSQKELDSIKDFLDELDNKFDNKFK
ncbi:helix-turn-helix domain-containing protein [Enterococcus gallinarum]|uniref:helix-turn-helix domain-containing protein n=1 Tax=Enterococcus TaxID=1350 RepID=UPI003BF78557